VLNSLGSPASRRVYGMPSTNHHLVLFRARWLQPYRCRPLSHLPRIKGTGSEHNQPAARCGPTLAHEAAILAVSPNWLPYQPGQGRETLGFRVGNWLSADQSSEVLKLARGRTPAPSETTAMLPSCSAVVYVIGTGGLESGRDSEAPDHWVVVT